MKDVNIKQKEIVSRSAREVKGPAAVVPLQSEPAPRLIVDAPLPEPLTFGRVVIQYRTENVRMLPVYGSGALDVSPRVGHLHITVDNASWHWLDASGEPLTLNGFTAGEHSILIELADATHKITDSKTVTFILPGKPGIKNMITSFLQQLNNQDADAIADLFAENIDWYVAGNPQLPWTGHRSHKAAVATYFKTMWPYFKKGESTSTQEKIITEGNDAVILATFTHVVVSSGRTFRTPVAMHLSVADGKIIKLHLYEDTWVVSNAMVK